MEHRRLGRTEHESTLAILGAFSIGQVNQREADLAMELVLEHGVNHIDVAPTYDAAEERLRPWMGRARDHFFLGCKTGQRKRQDAADELLQSLKRLGVDHFDLYQLHAVTNLEELDQVTRAGGALEALVEARQAGLTRFLGITGHGLEAPEVFLEALRRFDFDTILFPLNFVLYANPTYRENTDALLHLCRQRDVGTMIIKSIARGPWGNRPPSYHTWYQPFDDPKEIQSAVDFTLSQDVTGICTAGDVRLLPAIIQACENFSPMSPAEQAALLEEASAYHSIFSS
jgi:predicted aldo/keto reductase-like oxidoreductase